MAQQATSFSDSSDHVALITGANHGIGRATAQALAARGVDVLVTYLRTEGVGDQYPSQYKDARSQTADDVVSGIRSLGRRCHAIEADLQDEATVTMLFDAAEQHFGPVDILINNASGHSGHDSFASTRAVGKKRAEAVLAKTVDGTFAVDAKASALLISEFARRYLQRDATWGRIVGLTSGGPNGFPGEVTYGAAKAAQENFTMSAAYELGKYGVTANMVYPPVTDTGWVTDEVRDFVETSSEHFHIADPADVANVIRFLCTPDADMVTGNIIHMR